MGIRLILYRIEGRENKIQNGQLYNLFEVQQFLGFCRYYRPFIPQNSEKVEPLTQLTKPDEPFLWESKWQLALESMVTGLTTAPTLRHFNHEREVIIESDPSNYVSAGIVSQPVDGRVLDPVAYYSKKHTPAE
jgi:hypothetical protein